MGSDMWESYDTWHKADELKTLVKPFVVSREKVPVSSTEIRESPEKAGIPAAVWEYIRREGLYGHDNCVIMPSE
jgi:nicotinic acid mononucleotide adenylyltransferase